MFSGLSIVSFIRSGEFNLLHSSFLKLDYLVCTVHSLSYNDLHAVYSTDIVGKKISSSGT
jgi:hypothetical protein